MLQAKELSAARACDTIALGQLQDDLAGSPSQPTSGVSAIKGSLSFLLCLCTCRGVVTLPGSVDVVSSVELD